MWQIKTKIININDKNCMAFVCFYTKSFSTIFSEKKIKLSKQTITKRIIICVGIKKINRNKRPILSSGETLDSVCGIFLQ